MQIWNRIILLAQNQLLKGKAKYACTSAVVTSKHLIAIKWRWDISKWRILATQWGILHHLNSNSSDIINGRVISMNLMFRAYCIEHQASEYDTEHHERIFEILIDFRDFVWNGDIWYADWYVVIGLCPWYILFSFIYHPHFKLFSGTSVRYAIICTIKFERVIASQYAKVDTAISVRLLIIIQEFRICFSGGIWGWKILHGIFLL